MNEEQKKCSQQGQKFLTTLFFFLFVQIQQPCFSYALFQNIAYVPNTTLEKNVFAKTCSDFLTCRLWILPSPTRRRSTIEDANNSSLEDEDWVLGQVCVVNRERHFWAYNKRAFVSLRCQRGRSYVKKEGACVISVNFMGSYSS